ncbi:MAG: NYN domain-containing protein [Propionibacteriaceae bacterium]|nr:NYN domain-containing protein [Propionibacteriaceae bacterium]
MNSAVRPHPTALLYIDGLNLYRRCLEDHPNLKWLDLQALAENLLPGHDVIGVHYFTALLKPGTSPDPRKPTRQQVYLRAIATLPQVIVHLGKFRIDTRWMISHPVSVDPATGEYRRTQVRKIEEKGSDVSLAVHMLADAYASRADLYAMLTNDSDQAETLRVLKTEAGCRTGLILPMETARASKELMKTNPDVISFVTRDILRSSQLPDRIADAHGVVSRPPEWTS